MLKIEGLAKKLGRGRELRSIQLAVDIGDVVLLTGSDQSGGETLLRIAAGMIEPDIGEVSIFGMAFAAHRRGALARVGYVCDIPANYASVKSDEFLKFVGGLHGLKANDLRFAITRVARLVEMNEGILLPIRDLRSSERQRLSLAAALIAQPQIVIWDEPMRRLDALQMASVSALIASLSEHHGFLIAATDPEPLADIVNKIVVLHAGRSVFSGHVSEFLSKDFSFPGSPSARSIAGRPVSRQLVQLLRSFEPAR